MKLAFLIILILSLTVSVWAQIDSSNSVSQNNLTDLVFRSRILFGTGISTQDKNDDAPFKGIGNFNLRFASHTESWTNKSIDMFLETGLIYITESLAESKGNGIPYYLRFGAEIDIYKTLLVCPSFGIFGILNRGPESKAVIPTLGISINYLSKITDKLNLEIEGGSNIYETGVLTPYIVVGISF